MEGDEVRRAAERVARESYGRLIAFLAARSRDLESAEDALSEAFAAALETWPARGVPDNPDAWLLTAARRRQTDKMRRARTRAAHADHLAHITEDLDMAARETGNLPDRRLALMFACAHPAIDPMARTPLILQTILGLTAKQIATAFLVSPATVGQRLVRAKARIRDTGIALAEPDPQEMAERLDAVLAAIYAAFARGWSNLEEPSPTSLAEEAIWLGRLVVALLPDEPEAKGMLALMLFAAARRQARRDEDGRFVPLGEQDVSKWDMTLIEAAERLLAEANAGGPTGRYQLEAAIQSAHTTRILSGQDTWQAIVALYDHLLARTKSPVVALNRAVALAETEGAPAALDLVRELADDKRLTNYQPYWATRGHIAANAGDVADAHEALTLAIGLSTDPAERAYLVRRRDALRQG